AAEAARALQHGPGGATERLRTWRRARELRLDIAVAPRLVGDAAEREACLLDHAAGDLEADRYGDQGESVGQAVADFQIGVVGGEALGRQLDRRDDLVRLQGGVDFRRVARQALEVGKGDAALAAGAGDQHARLERGERHAHVRRVCGDAMLARPQDGVHAVDAVDRRAAAARRALVAWRRRI